MSKTLERSLKKIEKLFEKMQYNKIALNGKRNLANRTYRTYKDQMQALLREANGEFGIEKIEDFSLEMFKKLIEKRVDRFLDGEFSESSSINSKITAFKTFLLGMDETNVYRKTKKSSEVFKIDYRGNEKKGISSDFDKLRTFVAKSGVYRKGSDSTVLRATSEQILTVVENVRAGGYNTLNRSKAADIALLSLVSGARISSCLKMKVEDIDFDNKYITIKDAKGGLTYYVDIADEDIPLLKSFVEDLKPNQNLFKFSRKDGTFLSNEEARKIVHRYVNEGGKDFFEVEKRKIKNEFGKEIEVDHQKNFAFHTIRKGFSLETMSKYIDKIKSQNDILKELERLAARDPKIMQKYDRLIERSNRYRREQNEKLRKEGKEIKALKNEISIRQAVTFFTSIQLGHFRNDIVTNYYCSYEEAYKQKHKH